MAMVFFLVMFSAAKAALGQSSFASWQCCEMVEKLRYSWEEESREWQTQPSLGLDCLKQSAPSDVKERALMGLEKVGLDAAPCAAVIADHLTGGSTSLVRLLALRALWSFGADGVAPVISSLRAGAVEVHADGNALEDVTLQETARAAVKALGFSLHPACDIENSNNLPGEACACKTGYHGVITWHGDDPSGECKKHDARFSHDATKGECPSGHTNGRCTSSGITSQELAAYKKRHYDQGRSSTKSQSGITEDKRSHTFDFVQVFFICVIGTAFLLCTYWRLVRHSSNGPSNSSMAPKTDNLVSKAPPRAPKTARNQDSSAVVGDDAALLDGAALESISTNTADKRRQDVAGGTVARSKASSVQRKRNNCSQSSARTAESTLPKVSRSKVADTEKESNLMLSRKSGRSEAAEESLAVDTQDTLQQSKHTKAETSKVSVDIAKPSLSGESSEVTVVQAAVETELSNGKLKTETETLEDRKRCGKQKKGSLSEEPCESAVATQKPSKGAHDTHDTHDRPAVAQTPPSAIVADNPVKQCMEAMASIDSKCVSDVELSALEAAMASLQQKLAMEKARREVIADERDDSCVVCFSARRSVVLVDCGHFVVCESCSIPLKTCPICRNEVRERCRVFSG